MTVRKFALCTLALAAVACGGDSTTQAGGALTTEQLQSMTSALSFLFGVSFGQPQTGSSLSSRVAASRVMASEIPLSGSASCPQGGHIGTGGTFSIDSVGDAIYALTDTLVDCAIKDNHSSVWTFNSKPTVAVTLDERTNIQGDSIDVAHSTLTQTDVGSLQYSTGNLSGTCPLDISLTFEIVRGTPTADSARFSVSTTGKVCNRSVTRDTSVTVPYTPPPT